VAGRDTSTMSPVEIDHYVKAQMAAVSEQAHTQNNNLVSERLRLDQRATSAMPTVGCLRRRYVPAPR
jgi:hypothetical protein